MRHRWSDAEMEETIDICLEYAPGSQREAAGQAMVAQPPTTSIRRPLAKRWQPRSTQSTASTTKPHARRGG